jgi:DmsE family decaheme c-type cytochrome
VSSYSTRFGSLLLLCSLSLHGTLYAQATVPDAGAEPEAATENATAAPPDTAAEPTTVEPTTVEPTTAEPAAAESGAASDPAQQSQATPPEAPEQSPSYTEEGADSCLKCHDEDSEVPVLDLFKTRHAVKADARTPFAQLQCESCHGPGGEHARRVRRGEPRPPIRNFGKRAATPIAEQNAICLDCHAKHDFGHWPGSPHQRNDVACASCHRVHATHDPALTPALQTEVCLDCHKQQRAEIHKASTHPVRYGQMSCTDCHAPHGSAAETLLKRATLNQTCYGCHAEKRGPFLWEHAPASEDCSLCHRPHGSNHPDLLTRRAPLLCQQCHSAAGHPSVQYTGRGLAGVQPSPRVLAGSCTNCHSQVHGSNHPSGASLTR